MQNYDTASGQLGITKEPALASSSPSGHDLASTALNDIDRFLSTTKERLERNSAQRDYLNQLISEDGEAIAQLVQARDSLRMLFGPKSVATKDYMATEQAQTQGKLLRDRPY